MVREFVLENEKGQRHSLMDIKNSCLLTEPRGLGYSYKTEYKQVGNTFIENIGKIEQKTINGSLNFLNYDNYTDLINFVESSEKLKFVYKIPYKNKPIVEFFKDVKMQSLEKTEIQPNGVITELVIFDCLSLWYEENKTVYKIEAETDEIRWDFTWDSVFVDYDTRNLTYINNGHVEAPIEVSMTGKLINPCISLCVENELVQEIKFNTTIQDYEKLLYGTKENEFYIYRQKVDGTIESLFNLDVIDFYNDNVIRIPVRKKL